MTLDAHSFELVLQKTVFCHSQEVYYAEMAEMFKKESQARHTFTSSIISCALTGATLTFVDLAHLQLTPRLTLPVLFFCFFLAARHPATSTMCPTAGAQALTVSSLMTWYPRLSGPALHCRVPFPLLCFFLSKSRGYRHVVFFHLTVSAFVVVLSCLLERCATESQPNLNPMFVLTHVNKPEVTGDC